MLSKYLLILLCVLCAGIAALPTPENLFELQIYQDKSESEENDSSVKEVKFAENGEILNESTEQTLWQDTPRSPMDQGYYNDSSRVRSITTIIFSTIFQSSYTRYNLATW